MGVEDYAFTLLMMFSVVRQLRGRRLTWFGLSWPVALVLYAGYEYMSAVPVQGHNVVLVAVLGLIGLTLGLACGRLSHVYVQRHPEVSTGHVRSGGAPVGLADVMVRSTGTAAVLWVAGIGSRLVFALWAEHGGGLTLEHLSQTWQITSTAAWSTALILMSLLEVAGRTTQLAPRLLQARARATTT